MEEKSFVSRSLRESLMFFFLFFILTGFVYTVVLTGICQVVLSHQANGSVIEIDGKTYGTEHMAQYYTSPRYLWGRSMNMDLSTFTHNGKPVMYATPTNKSPAGKEMDEMVKARIEHLLKADPSMKGVPIPVDLLTVSGSSMDPGISPAGAAYQKHRVATARGISEDEVQKAIDAATTGKLLGVLGNPEVNVLKVNLILDGIIKE